MEAGGAFANPVGETSLYLKGRRDKTVDSFTAAYIEAALWSSNDESTPQGGQPLDANYTAADIAPETLALMTHDCEAFQRAHAADIALDLERAGHDFWLTRNHHGAGFWDGDWSDKIGNRLTTASHAFGDFSLYIGDDGRVHGCNG